jgi:predicted nucleic acid-binding protein
MRIFLDTNVLFAAVVHSHPNHHASNAVLQRVQDGRDQGFIAAHSLAELYSVLTRIPPPTRHSPEQALATIHENVLEFFKVFALSAADYTTLIRESALAGIRGGTIYDAILIKCAVKAEVERIYTANLRHFQTVAPADMTSRIFSP